MKKSKKIKKIISKILSFKKKIKNSHSFENDLEIDSLDKIELFMSIEKKFKIKIHDKEIEKINIVKDLIDLTKKKIKNKK
jgi:acyl carrier protein